MPGTDISEKNPLHVSEVDDNLKELSPHGSFELPVETYTGNCEIFHALYDHWHSEMEIMYIEKGSGFARLNRESIRLKKYSDRKLRGSSQYADRFKQSSLL